MSHSYVERYSVYNICKKNNNENNDGFDYVNIYSFYKSKESKVEKQMTNCEKHNMCISRSRFMILYNISVL